MLSIFLAKLLGIYMILVGLIFMLRRKAMMPAMKELIKNKSLIYIIAIRELLAGLAIILGHNIWTLGFEVIITVVGWLMLLEGIIYLILPNRLMQKLFGKFNTPVWYGAGGVAAIIIGLYLAGRGFGLI